MGGRRSLDLAIPAIMVALVVFTCFAGPVVYPVPAPIGGSILAANLPMFSPGHFLGTDLNGNDNLSRLLHGGRVSIAIALAVNITGVLLGGFLGGLAGYLGGGVDAAIARVTDVLIAFPSLVLALAIVHVLGPGLSTTMLALAFFSIPAYTRVARAATLRLRDRPFIFAARLGGATVLKVIFGHVAPNVLPQLATFGLLGIGIAVIIEGALSFLGLGIPPPQPSWGNMIANGQEAILTRPSLLLMPSLFLVLTGLSFNMLGEAVRIRWARL